MVNEKKHKKGVVIMIKSTYLGDVLYFDSLQETIYYYGFGNDKNVKDLMDLQEALKEEAEGMGYPIIEEL